MLKGKNISIRTIAERDLDDLIIRLGDFESLGNYMPLDFISESQFKRQYAENGFIQKNVERYVITSSKDELLGSIWVFMSIPYFNALEVGYYIFDANHRSKGYATESLTLLSDHLFRVRNINRLEVRMAVENKASENVAQRAGFSLEGTSREAAFSNGRHYDMRTYSLLRKEWEETCQKS